MIEITRSSWGMALAVVAALLFGLGRILATIAFAILSGPAQVGTANDLLTASAWLAAVAGGAAVLAVGAGVFSAVAHRTWAGLWEIGGAVAATFVIAIGLLVNAATAPDGSLGANIVAAVGFGMWAVLIMVKAAQRSLVERVSSGSVKQAPWWMVAAGGTLLVAVAVGLPNATVEDEGLGVATAVLWMAGLAVIALSLGMGRRLGLIVSRRYNELAAGLWTLVAAYAASAIVAGAVFGPFPSLTGVRIGVAMASVIAALAFGLLALAAWDRLRDLSLLENGPPPFASPIPSPCGHPIPDGAHFCPQCGAPAYPVSSFPSSPTADPETM